MVTPTIQPVPQLLMLIIERPLDTFRTAVNVEGDLIAALVIDKWHAKERGQLDEPVTVN